MSRGEPSAPLNFNRFFEKQRRVALRAPCELPNDSNRAAHRRVGSTLPTANTTRTQPTQNACCCHEHQGSLKHETLRSSARCLGRQISRAHRRCGWARHAVDEAIC